MLKEIFKIIIKMAKAESLNPYFNGTCSKSGVEVFFTNGKT